MNKQTESTTNNPYATIDSTEPKQSIEVKVEQVVSCILKLFPLIVPAVILFWVASLVWHISFEKPTFRKGQSVIVTDGFCLGEEGIVVGKVHSLTGSFEYLVRFDRFDTEWIDESDLEAK